MPPAKSRANQDDSKSDAPSTKEKNGTGSKDNHTNGGTKLRRVASSAGSNLKEVATVNGHSAVATTPAAAQPAPPPPPGLDWSSFDRELLHDYRREHHLDTPTAFALPYHQIVLSRPGSIGLYSPSMARKRQYKRQSRNELTQVVRKHFNGLGIQENEVVVNFLHKVKNPGVTRPRRDKNLPHASPMP
ncbi:hypothetical protein PFICI_04453 [Pestalotiopsis fici W106-1]|uniref:Histone deacetylase complex subunit SAP30 Sin3 binding domain-containing protein n=1 Tax=Pestalotiopsis fici (strain W106-1 / CGMCC3.15140) TaxID=1229662 RepID=W3XAV8_PESFW|nr:uncharacterized protein PFICI_04453 [Pestalotiopsis fici W106-1]ETS82577.1 hypothetical protein PFICI_04453 [Pestalotiopsis fici W106-1]